MRVCVLDWLLVVYLAIRAVLLLLLLLCVCVCVCVSVCVCLCVCVCDETGCGV